MARHLGEHARRGFFELCGIAAINLAVTYLMILLSRRQNGRLPLVLRLTGTFLSLFTILIIATACAKDWIYIQNLGMTVRRVGAGAAMLCMAALFVALLLKCYLPRVRILPVALVVGALTLSVLGVGNLNRVAAKYNYEGYRSGRYESVDCNYLYDLGDEAVPYLVKLAEEGYPGADANLFCAAANLYRDLWDYEPPVSAKAEKAETGPRSYAKPSQYSVARAEAYRALDDFLAAHPDWLTKGWQAYSEGAWGDRDWTDF